ncbi:MAG: polyribonucleotide nucleotidyltransferase [Bacteroidota bacterium]
MNVVRKSTTLPDGREITLETGLLAKQADGAVVVKCGETMLLATVVARKDINLETDFLPLSVDYLEKFAAAGKFPGGFFKREGKMTEGEVLTSRLIDRAIRPLFPSNYHADTQVMVQMISTDSTEQPDALACLAVSAALSISDIPFPDPVTEGRVARKNGEFVFNPTFQDMAECDVDLLVAATNDSINMVEGEMKEVGEDVMLEALKFAHEHIKILNNLQLELKEAAGKETRDYEFLETKQEMYDELKELIADRIAELTRSASEKQVRSKTIREIKEEAKEKLSEKYAEEDEYFDARFAEYFKSIQKNVVRGIVLSEKLRLDGRSLDQVRPISCEVSYLPRVHGSAVFTRGETQSLCTVTLGTKLDQQTIDTATFSGSKKFILHYNFPGFSTGEVRPNRGPGRREIGHGNLAERALKGMIPEDTPYTIRIVSHILESNGSSSMASVCGGTLGLMDAGIKITRPVSGIAMGLITDDEGNFAVLSDILGDEDALGDMDFKVTGTTEGLTACQMDIKVRGLSYEIIAKALEQSKEGRMYILEEMMKTQSEPSSNLSPYAPRFFTMTVPHEFFGNIIGPGGKVIQEIQKTSQTTIVLEEGQNNVGKATITSSDSKGIEEAVRQIRALITMPVEGEIYDAKVKSIMPYGAFVEFLPGKEGLLHISEITNRRLNNVEEILKVGDKIKIQLIGVDKKTGKFRLSRKVLLAEGEE